MEYLMGANILSLNFLFTVMMFIIVSIGVLSTIRRLWWQKVKNENKIVKDLKEGLYQEANNIEKISKLRSQVMME